MGLLRGEGTILRNKYMKKYGIGQREAITMVEAFVAKINAMTAMMRSIRIAWVWYQLRIPLILFRPSVNIKRPDIMKRMPMTPITQGRSHSRAPSKNTTASANLIKPAM